MINKVICALSASLLFASSANSAKIDQCNDSINGGAKFYLAELSTGTPAGEQRVTIFTCYYKYENRGHIIGQEFRIQSPAHEYRPKHKNKWSGIQYRCGESGKRKPKECAVISAKFK